MTKQAIFNKLHEKKHQFSSEINWGLQCAVPILYLHFEFLAFNFQLIYWWTRHSIAIWNDWHEDFI